ncbi:MAG: transposase family protein, partial [Chloroflexi bacterium]|nr:transposase family protein [Chloroflexota bacterium]
MAGDPLREGVLGAFARGHDPRSRRARRYPLEGLLAMLVLAALHGERSLRGMWVWGKQHWAEIRRPLGFLGNRHAPAYGTLHGVLSALPADALDEALGAWSQEWAEERLRGISIDGKTLRGSRRTNPPQGA